MARVGQVAAFEPSTPSRCSRPKGTRFGSSPGETRSSRSSQFKYAADALKLAGWADVVVLQKPAHPPSLLDAIARRNPRLVVDFDDAVWASPTREGERQARILGRRLDHAIERAGVVTVGSHLLAAAVLRGHPDAEVTVMPSPVDLRWATTKEHVDVDRPVVGWIGSPENLADFEPAIGGLIALGTAIRLRVVSSAPLETVPGAEFEPWTAGAEHEALLGFDVGIMPLNDDQRSRGRCAFKAIQYMAAGLPVVASPVGAAGEVVEDGMTGFLAEGLADWTHHLDALARDVNLRQTLGRAGRVRTQERFSYATFIPQLREVLERRRRAG